MLYTDLNHIETAADYAKIVGNNENAVVICGRMTHSCIQVYRIAKELENTYKHISIGVQTKEQISNVLNKEYTKTMKS